MIDHVRQRRLTGLSPSTVWNDLCWIRVVLDAAKTAKNLPFPLDAIDEARKYCVKHRLIARSKRRERRPTNEELQKLDEYFRVRDCHRCTVVPMRPIIWFAIYSARRESEICRLEWGDNDAMAKSGLVRDAKHPREKLGNHLRFKYTPQGWDIVHAQPKYSRYVFPYNPKSVSDAFTSACRILGIEDLRFHDLRHEAISRLFELGYDIHEVAQFSLHSSWEDLKRYTHLRPENLRQVVIKPSGEIEVITPPGSADQNHDATVSTAQGSRATQRSRLEVETVQPFGGFRLKQNNSTARRPRLPWCAIALLVNQLRQVSSTD